MDDSQQTQLYQLAYGQGRTEALLRRVQGLHRDACDAALADWQDYGECVRVELGLDDRGDLNTIQAVYVSGFVAGYRFFLHQQPEAQMTHTRSLGQAT